MTEEIWKDIEGFESLYKISNLGNVFGIKRKKILKLRIDSNGYNHIVLCKNNKENHFKIHRLVAKHFLENWNEKLQVDHIDRNRQNNNYKNLRMCNPSENSCNKKIRSDSSTGYKNIYYKIKSDSYKVNITKDKKRYTKTFKSLREAIIFYNEKVIELHGDYAVLNEIPN